MLRRVGIGTLSVMLAFGLHATPARADDGQPTQTELTTVAVPETSTSPSASQRVIAHVKKSRTNPFELVGVTWTSQAGPAPTVKVRALGDSWSEWINLDVEASEEDSVRGTEPAYVGTSTAVEVRIFGAPTTTVSGVEAVLISPGDNPEGFDSQGVAPAAASNQVSAPPIVMRSDWGADESWLTPSCVKPVINKTLKAAVVHHTAGTNTYTPAEAPGIVRGIYAYHVKSRGWCDIGYNFLIDKFGTVYEGRHGGITQPVHGAHAGKWNTDTVGVSIMMDSNRAAATPAAMSATAQVIAWRLAPYRVDPLGKTYLVDGMYDTIVGHGSVMPTDCPGTDIRAKLPMLRTMVDDIMRSAVLPGLDSAIPNAQKTSTVGDQNGDGRADLVVYRPATDKISVMQSYGSVLGRPAVVSSGWGQYDWMNHVPDVTGDGRFDLLLRGKNGHMWLRSGQGHGQYGDPVLVGWGFNRMRDMVVTDDMNGDKKPDLIAIDTDGTLRRWSINGDGYLSHPSVLSRPGAFRHTSRLGSIGDFNGNSTPDIFAVNSQGYLTAYFFSRGKIAAQRTLGRGWTPFLQMTPADLDGDGKLEMVARHSNGVIYMYRQSGKTLSTAKVLREGTAAFSMHA